MTLNKDTVVREFERLAQAITDLPEQEMRTALESILDGAWHTARDPLSSDDDDRVTICYVCKGVEGCEKNCPADNIWRLI